MALVITAELGQGISKGVLSMLYGMTAPEARGGALYGPRYFHLAGYPAETRANRAAYDADALERFWDVFEQLTGVTYLFAGQPAEHRQPDASF